MSRDPATSATRNSSRGYILITMMLFMALVAMAALAILPKLAQQAQRDREEEMVHRGTEYMRAVKKYYKKFGRYPTRIEELENSNQQRFLRKRFKDPMAKGNKGDQDFRLVRVGDPALNMLGMGGIGAGPGIAPGAGAGGNPNFVAGANGGVRQAGPNDTNAPQVTGLPGQQNQQPAKPAGDDSGDADTADDAKSAGSSSNSANSGSGDAPGGQVFGGGPLLGVASTSKLKTIREYNKKNHYNDWLFIYDPNSDRSAGLLKGPIEPDATRNAGINPGAPPVPGQPNPPGPPVPTPAQGPQPSPQPSQDDQ